MVKMIVDINERADKELQKLQVDKNEKNKGKLASSLLENVLLKGKD